MKDSILSFQDIFKKDFLEKVLFGNGKAFFFN